ncbi:MAG TPA: YfiR family protein [candidate division Zixibacteria bacterium]|nr:YfiR family protein [candidate division Zixibacteria bacterium]
MKRLIVLTLCLLVSAAVFAQGNDSKSLTNKAQFIIDLVDNMEWTTGKKLPDTETVTICVVENAPIVAKLKELAAKHDGNRKFDIKVVDLTDDLGSCHIVYLPTDDLGKLAKVLKKVADKKVVTVSDAQDFARYGVMINFIDDAGSGKLKYEVNKMVLDMTGIKLSQDLLKEAVII